MHLFVTGVAGFIGSRVTEMLLEQGHTMYGVDNLCPAYDLRLKQYRLDKLNQLPGFRFQQADIADRQSIERIWQEHGPFDAVVNLAARAGVRQSVENPWVYVDTNVTGTLNLLELCRQDGVGKFVLASTSSLYGANNPVPFSEDANTDRPLVALRRLEEGRRGAVLHLPPPVRPRRDRLPLLHRLRPGRPPRHEPLPLRPVDPRGPAAPPLRRRDAVARLHLRRRHRPGHHPRAEAAGLRGDQPGRRQPARPARADRSDRAGGRARRPTSSGIPMHAADVMATWADIGKAQRLLGLASPRWIWRRAWPDSAPGTARTGTGPRTSSPRTDLRAEVAAPLRRLDHVAGVAQQRHAGVERRVLERRRARWRAPARRSVANSSAVSGTDVRSQVVLAGPGAPPGCAGRSRPPRPRAPAAAR